MITEAQLNFVAPGSPLSLVAAAGVDVAAPIVYDMMGNGVNTVATNIFGNQTVPWTADAMSAGFPKPQINVVIGTALVADTGTPLLTVEFQGAPDAGSGVPGTWQTYTQSPDITVAQGTANQVIRLDFFPPFPLNNRPRFLRLNFKIPAGTNFSAGTILSAVTTTARDDWYAGQFQRNYNAPRVIS